MPAPYYLANDFYTRKELLDVLKDTEEMNRLRCRIEMIEAELRDKVLMKGKPCARANLTREAENLRRQLQHLRYVNSI
jgi:hypothetical protein